MTKYILLLFSLLLFSSEANAQAPTKICFTTNGANCVEVTAANPFPITGTLSATFTGYSPRNFGTPITATTGGVTGALPTNTGQVVLTNVGTTNLVYCALGAVATTSSQPIAPNGGWFAFGTVGVDTQFTCITSASTTVVNSSGGAPGLATGTGGGGGSGGGGAITAASGSYAAGALSSGAGVDGWDLTQGAKADGACASDNGTCSLTALIKRTNQNLTTVNTSIGSSIPTGTFDIGTIGVHSIVNVTPTNCSSTIASGGVAQNAITASATIHAYEIVNIDTTAECLYINKIGTAVAGAVGSACLSPATSTTTGGSYNSPLGGGFNTNLSVIAATTGHKYTCTQW